MWHVQSAQKKIEFIEKIHNQTEIPSSIEKLKIETKILKKIFFRVNNGDEIKRKWLLFDEEENCFQCVYCSCCGYSNKFAKGVQYSIRIVEYIKRHETQQQHKAAECSCMNLISPNQTQNLWNSEKTETLRLIIKTIIFTATHSKQSTNYFSNSFVGQNIEEYYFICRPWISQ